MSDPPDTVTVFIPGNPVPQGSKTVGRGGGKSWVRDANASRLKPWRHIVAVHADVGVTFDVPVVVTLAFLLPKPQRPRWVVPAVKPDLDKLTRAALDGLTDGGLLGDDARVVDLHVTKRYPGAGELVGVRVTVQEWTDE